MGIPPLERKPYVCSNTNPAPQIRQKKIDHPSLKLHHASLGSGKINPAHQEDSKADGKPVGL